ncbi:MAG: hypothetical protein COV29_02005 [Candidatus Yanofskybacteria bacterium CG10_big_fil_rev_8_21_14_0_10_36_16]|uniref:O-antigen ligase-related domain-containing protein n=1 Tax=Candidatus Yanofskybacteria bacterium CG10_big_fil_rev_8_21_14_0_10_36_16 TaxID=1975096 RepID=A0A2J0Q7G6_9BACT|nr:MAG: hypothetical protein COV29_02005 [Candidatus Yanofskybacteria bacterium CG10_big_fil_rev_8_21_14_0_10_36_16]
MVRLKTQREDWIVKILKAGVYLTAFVPLIIFSEFVSPFHFGKVVVFRSLVELIAVFYLILVLKDRSWLPPKHPLLVVFGLLTASFVLTTATSINPYLSFWGSLERMGGLWSFVHYLVYFVILISVFKERKDWHNILRLTIFVGFLSAVYGFGQKTDIDFIVGSGGRTRIFGTIGNAALFAGYQLVTLFLAGALAFSNWVSNRERSFLLIAAFVSSIAVLMTAVRGSVLGLGVGLIVYTILHLIVFRSHAARKILTAIMALAVLYGFFVFAFKDSDFVKNSGYLTRMTDVSFKTYTVQTRFWAWSAGIDGWNDSTKTILLGWGPENFNVPFSIHFNPKFFAGLGSETLFDRAHNMFVEVLVTMGLLTFLVYIAMFLVAFRLIWTRAIKDTQDQSKKNIGIGLISLIVAYMIHNAFIFDTSANFVVFFTTLGLIVWLTPKQMGVVENYELGSDKNKNNTAIRRVFPASLSSKLQLLMIILLVGAMVLIYQTNILQSKANYALTRAIRLSWAGEHAESVEKYKEALAYNVPGKYEHRNRFAQYVLERTNNKDLSDKDKQDLIFAIEQVNKNIEETNLDYLPYLYVSRLNIVLGKDEGKNSKYNDDALENSMKALEISPTFVRTYYEVGQAYINKGELEKAVEYFQKAVDLHPEVGLSHWYLAATYFDLKEFDKGFKEMQKARELGYVFSEGDILRLINIYVSLNDYQKIAILYETLVEFKPNNPQYHASLAAAYARIGRIEEAIEQALKAAEIDSSYQLEADRFIRTLKGETVN